MLKQLWKTLVLQLLELDVMLEKTELLNLQDKLFL